jgi:protein MpaA
MARFWILLLVGTAMAGCKTTERRAGELGVVETTKITVGRSLENRPIEARILGRGADVVLIIASIHGNEKAGTPLVNRLQTHLLAHPELMAGRRVVIVPVANPDGSAKNIRANARGVDLNRNYPTTNRVAGKKSGIVGLSEPESQAIEKVMTVYPPARIVSIHQPLTCVDFDGPADELAQRMSSASGLPVKKIGALPGSLGSYAGITMGIPIVTYELPRSADALDEAALWDKYGEGLVEAVKFELGK